MTHWGKNSGGVANGVWLAGCEGIIKGGYAPVVWSSNQMIVVFLKSQVCLFNKNSTAVVEQSGFFGGGLAPFIVLYVFCL